MRRRVLLATAGTVSIVLAGCLGDESDDRTSDDSNGADDRETGSGDEESDRQRTIDVTSVREAFDDGPSRPECTIESETITVESGDEQTERETASTVPYPDPPERFDRETVVEYVEEFDHASVTQDVLCDRERSDHVLRIAHTVSERETYDWNDEISVVFLLRAAGAREGATDDGTVWQADIGPSGVVYAVDETGVARAGFPDAGGLEAEEFEADAPDPIADGTLVAVFD